MNGKKRNFFGKDDAGAGTLKEQGFYKKAVWRKLRSQVLERDHYLCQECLRRKRFTKATEVHHLKPLEEFPELGLTPSNLESLCWFCHEATKSRSRAEPTVPDGVRVIKI